MKMEKDQYQFKIADLKKLLLLIIKKLNADGVENLELVGDEYWFISQDAALDLSKTPQLLVGSLKEDFHYLNEALVEGEIFSYSSLDRVATILKLISEKQSPSG